MIALVYIAQVLFAETTAVTNPTDIPAYYASLNEKSAAGLYEAVHATAKKGYKSLSYKGLWSAYATTDLYPKDPSNPDYDASLAGRIWDMYSNCEFVYSKDQCGSYNSECDCYNREHSIPKSWFGGSEGNNTPGSDIFHVVPTDGYVNNIRSNYAFGEVSSASYSYDGSKLGSGKAISITHTMLGDSKTSKTCEGDRVFEPQDRYKGDFARGYLGALLRWSTDYQAFTSGDGGKIFSGKYTAAGHFGLTEYGIALLLKWHRQDPVSQKEIDRNNGIQQVQGNRNPFIDYPYLAEFIWGERSGEKVYVNQLMASTDADFVPGQSNGWRGGEPIVDPDPEDPDPQDPDPQDPDPQDPDPEDPDPEDPGFDPEPPDPEQDPDFQGIDDVFPHESLSTYKVLIDGHLYIVVNDQLYTLTGQAVGK